MVLVPGEASKDVLLLAFLQIITQNAGEDLKNQNTYRSERVLVRAGVSYEAFGLRYAVNVVLVCSDMVASIKLRGTWKRIGTGDERQTE